MEYPIFSNPQQYLAFRRGGCLAAPFRKWSERRTLDRCLKGLDDINTICDCPCGPGRLFSYWKKRNFNVVGVDLSDEMLEAARHRRNDLNMPGEILKTDAFGLQKALTKKPDMVVSIRFFYYFERNQRVQLLRSLAAATRKYLLIQYKTATTLKGRINFAKSKRSSKPKKFCRNESILAEIREAGLVCLKIIPKGDSSDRVFVLARKPDEEITLAHRGRVYKPRTLRNSALVAAAMLIVMALSSYYYGLLGDIHERQAERIVRLYQDGNDHFYVVDSSHFEDLRTNKRLSVVDDIEQVDDLAMIDQTKAEDSFFLVKEEDLRKIHHTAFFGRLSLVRKMAIGADRFVLLSTEKRTALPAVRRGASYLILPYKNTSRA